MQQRPLAGVDGSDHVALLFRRLFGTTVLNGTRVRSANCPFSINQVSSARRICSDTLCLVIIDPAPIGSDPALIPTGRSVTQARSHDETKSNSREITPMAVAPTEWSYDLQTRCPKRGKRLLRSLAPFVPVVQATDARQRNDLRRR